MSTIRKFKDIPGPRKIPLWGTLYMYKLGIYKIEEYHKVLGKLHDKYGPVVREDMGPGKTLVHVFDPADARKVFESEGPTPWVEPLQETTQFYRREKKTSPGLGNTNGEEWHRLRSAVRKPLLRLNEVQRFLPDVNKIADDLVERLAEKSKEGATGEISNLRLEIAKWSREASGWVCFERRLGCFDKGQGEAEAAKMIETNRKIFKLSSELKFSLPIYRLIRQTPKWKELTRLEETIHESVLQLIEESFKDFRVGMNNNNNLLHYLASRNELSREDVQILILSVFGDGLSTTVPSLLYNLYCLATNVKCQAKAREEVMAAAEGGKYISVEAINRKLHFLKAIVKETFRMYPIGTEISRILGGDLVLSGYHVPKGTHVHLNQIVHYKSGKYFKDPDKFIPERWLRNEADDVDPLLVVPFGHGTRTCAGRRFAEQDLYVLLSKILLEFELEYPENAPILEQKYRVLLFPEEPIRVRFKPRREIKGESIRPETI